MLEIKLTCQRSPRTTGSGRKSTDLEKFTSSISPQQRQIEERRNRQDLIEVFKISRGKSIIGLQDLFTLDKNNKGTRGHMLKLSKMRCTRDCWKYFFYNTVA